MVRSEIKCVYDPCSLRKDVQYDPSCVRLMTCYGGNLQIDPSGKVRMLEPATVLQQERVEETIRIDTIHNKRTCNHHSMFLLSTCVCVRIYSTATSTVSA